MTRTSTAFALGVAATIGTAPAVAAEAPAIVAETPRQDAVLPVDPWQRVFAIDATIGFGTPAGLIGVAAELTPIPYLSFAAGAGLGMWRSHTSGPIQLFASLRPRLPLVAGWALSISGGMSTGAYQWQEPPFIDAAQKSWERAYWLNVDAALERRFEDGLQLKIYAGHAWILNRGDGVCVGYRASALPRRPRRRWRRCAPVRHGLRLRLLRHAREPFRHLACHWLVRSGT